MFWKEHTDSIVRLCALCVADHPGLRATHSRLQLVYATLAAGDKSRLDTLKQVQLHRATPVCLACADAILLLPSTDVPLASVALLV